jgi:hypothetical protein
MYVRGINLYKLGAKNNIKMLHNEPIDTDSDTSNTEKVYADVQCLSHGMHNITAV